VTPVSPTGASDAVAQDEVWHLRLYVAGESPKCLLSSVAPSRLLGRTGTDPARRPPRGDGTVVQTTGGEYFFSPSIPAVADLAANPLHSAKLAGWVG